MVVFIPGIDLKLIQPAYSLENELGVGLYHLPERWISHEQEIILISKHVMEEGQLRPSEHQLWTECYTPMDTKINY